MKVRKIVLAGVAVLAMAVGMTSCLSDLRNLHVTKVKKITEVRNLKGFEEIEVNGSPTVYYSQADSFSVKVQGPEGSVEEILTEVKGQTLVVRNVGKMGILNFTMDNDHSQSVYVTSPDLISIRLNGSGDFVCKDRIDTDNMDIVLKGSGDISVYDLICDNCRVDLIGSGDIALKRLEAKETTAALVGSGDIDLNLYKVQNTRLSLKGSGDIDTDFSDDCGTVSCELRGSGDISLSGKVKHFTNQKSGSGDIDVHELTVK